MEKRGRDILEGGRRFAGREIPRDTVWDTKKVVNLSIRDRAGGI